MFRILPAKLRLLVIWIRFLLPGDGWLPLQLAFYPSREGMGSALGYGWTVPLLDSRLMETSESSFICISPDGQPHEF